MPHASHTFLGLAFALALLPTSPALGVTIEHRLGESKETGLFDTSWQQTGLVYAVVVEEGVLVFRGNGIALLDPETGEETRSLVSRVAEPMWQPAVCPREKLVTSIAPGGIELIRYDTGEVVRTLGRSDVHRNSAVFDPDCAHLVVNYDDGDVESLSVADGTVRWETRAGVFRSMVWADDRLLGGGADGTIQAIDPETGTSLAAWPAHPAAISSLSLSEDHTTLVSASRAGDLKVWDPAAGSLRGEIRIPFEYGMYAVSTVLAPEGKVGHAGTISGEVLTFSLETYLIEAHTQVHRDMVMSILPNPDGKGFISASVDGSAAFLGRGPSKPLEAGR